MKKTLTILATIILLLGCSTNPAGNENKAKIVGHIGTWNIYSDNTAQWTGSNNIRGGMAQTLGDNIIQSTGDTIIVNSVNLRGLWASEARNISYLDSSRAGTYQRFAGAIGILEPGHIRKGLSIQQAKDNSWFGALIPIKKGYDPSSIFVKMWTETPGDTLRYLFHVSGTDSMLNAINVN